MCCQKQLHWSGTTGRARTLNYCGQPICLAKQLIALVVASGDFVAKSLPRSPQQIDTLIAILISGGAYLPVDRNRPQRPLTFLLNDSRPALVITDSIGASTFREAGFDPLAIPSEWMALES